MNERLALFVLSVTLLAIAEHWRPDRQSRVNKKSRWAANFSLLCVDILVIRLPLPAGLIGIALWVEQAQTGLFAQMLLPGWLQTLITLVLLDLAIYAQHRASHQFSWLWRWHRIHHADPHIDFSTAVRFSPVEILISFAWKALCIVALGAHAMDVIVFEILLNTCALFNHANIRIPRMLEKPLRALLITPSVHRIHHSIKRVESDKNYGFSVPWWDWLFNSWQPQAQGPLQVGQKDIDDDTSTDPYFLSLGKVSRQND